MEIVKSGNIIKLPETTIDNVAEVKKMLERCLKFIEDGKHEDGDVFKPINAILIMDVQTEFENGEPASFNYWHCINISRIEAIGTLEDVKLDFLMSKYGD